MNKINYKIESIRQPVKTQSPDYRRSNRVCETHSPMKQIRRYLDSIKSQNTVDSNQQSNSVKYIEKSSCIQKIESVNEIYLRKRIQQLQRQNNQYRFLFLEYDVLVQKNKELEQQMCLLLEQLQQKQNSRQNQAYMKNTFLSFNTRQNQSEDDKCSKVVASGVRSVQSKQQINQNNQNTMKLYLENQILKKQNNRLLELFDLELKQSIIHLQKKFMNYIFSMQEKLGNLAFTNQQICKFQDKKSSQSSKKSFSSFSQTKNIDLLQNQQKMQQWNKWDKSSHNSSQNQQIVHKENNLDTAVVLQKESERQDENFSKQNSSVNIELQELSESNQSFGKINFKSKNSREDDDKKDYFSNLEIIDSQKIVDQNNKQYIFQKIKQSLMNVRQKMFLIFDLQNYSSENSNQEIYKLIFQEIQDIFQSCLPEVLNNAQKSKYRNDQFLQSECEFLKLKIKQQAQQINRLNRQTRLKQEQSPLSSRNKKISIHYLENSYYKDINCDKQMTEFEETKKKLNYIIEVIKQFNNEFRYLTTNSSRAKIECPSTQNFRY